MATKHDLLTENELNQFSISIHLDAIINEMLEENNMKNKTDLNVLDWGCGRGRSVIKLRQMGINAFGVDIDDKVILKGYPVLEKMGFDPGEILLDVRSVSSFPDGFFHLVFTEEVFEHICDMNEFAIELERLTVNGGRGLHTFPGTMTYIEPHLKIPLVHWFPKNRTAKWIILLALSLNKGPLEQDWPELKGKNMREKSEILYSYLERKTFYRDIDLIKSILEIHSFQVECTVINEYKKKTVPERMRKNGFPAGQIKIVSRKFK